METSIKNILQTAVSLQQQMLVDEQIIASVKAAVTNITHAFKSGHRIFFCGNGGSAADAQHLAAEFSGRFYNDRPALPAEALHCNTSYLTAVANDYGYDRIYARLIDGIGNTGDVLIGLSTSGNSMNIVRAFETARAKRITTIGLTGVGGGALKDLSDCWIGIPSNDTPRIQECHMLLGHTICQLVEAALFSVPETSLSKQ